MKPSKDQIINAVGRLSVMAMFPSSPAAQQEVMRLLDRMVGTVDQLNWLITTLIDRVPNWPGPKEVRGVYCTRYTPADGVEVEIGLQGFWWDQTPSVEETERYLRELKGGDPKLTAAIETLAIAKKLQ